ncbi:transcriptional regulator [Methylobacterium haplocladii]|uniref:Transcriptional regulator n=3 Tax=Methylobacterium haplocladii TaxID=1176176 RepID=A0A512ISF6_9HYPH|nr:transcriptional regulator [Methylobacterium haplocladii]GLS57785.1 transcriptional regulator [Methylobacterium haplocladii]
MVTGAQIRMARGYLRWSVRDLADTSGVSPATIKRMEESEGVPKAITDNLAKVEKALAEAGLEFIAENGGGPGVRLKAPVLGIQG